MDSLRRSGVGDLDVSPSWPLSDSDISVSNIYYVANTSQHITSPLDPIVKAKNNTTLHSLHDHYRLQKST